MPAKATISRTGDQHGGITEVSTESGARNAPSCHYIGGNLQLTPPTAGVFGTGTIGG